MTNHSLLRKIIGFGALILLLSSLAACGNPAGTSTQNPPFPPPSNSQQSTDGNGLIPSQEADLPPIKTCPPDYVTPQIIPADMQPDDYIGLKFYSHLPGVEYRSGLRLPSVNRRRLGVREIWDGHNRMVWLEWWFCSDSKGHPLWEIKDVILIPQTPKNQFLAFAVCGRSGALMPGIIAIGELSEQEMKILQTPGPDPLTIRDIKSAWMINLDTLQIDTIPTKGVYCHYSHVR